MRALLPVLVGAFLTPLICLHSPVHGESYFGDSYCSIQAIQDISSFKLSLTFKTSRRSGLLLLAAGMEDYLFLELLNGKLQARMKLEAEEVMLSSSQGEPLNNLVDHHVLLTLEDGKLTMTIDGLVSTYVPVGAGEERLNIDQGIWLGGTGDLDTPYLSNAIPPFRGCMNNIMLESHKFDILKLAFKQCHDTKESCSSEFDHNDGEAISFSTPDSFVSFPTWSGFNHDQRTLEFLMKTTLDEALLVFHHGSESDFIAVGVLGGHLKGVLDLGEGVKVLDNTQVQLDDDQWHRVKIQVSPTSFALIIDSRISSISLDSAQKLDLIGNLYFGGIQAKMKEVFHESGSLSRLETYMSSESFIGCFGEISVNQRDRTLQDALVTKDVHIKCEGEDYDYSAYYENETTTPFPPVIIQYPDPTTREQDCHPTESEPEVFRNVTKFLKIAPLLVPEGGETYLDINNLNPSFDLSVAGLRQSEIVFELHNEPLYGLVDINLKRSTREFTLLDVVNKKIKYMHDGNEGTKDQIQLEVFAQSNSYLPECLKTPQSYLLPVMIIPGNKQQTPGVAVAQITIAEKARSRLSPSLLQITQTDSSCDQLIITVTISPSFDFGYLENGKQPGRKISEFTCRELKDGNIFFIHKAGEASELGIKVSDGESVKQSGSFILLATQPSVGIVINAGLSLVQGSNKSIGIDNLNYIAYPLHGDILYNITNPPALGELRVRTTDGTYKEVTSFHQFHLEKELIRYFSTDASDQETTVVDTFQFNVYLGDSTILDNIFSVEIQPPKIKISNLEPLQVRAGTKQAIKNLQPEVSGRNPDPKTINYILVKPPSLGSLQILDEELKEGDIFTQMDILNDALTYTLRMQGVGVSFDQFQFRVFQEDQYSPTYNFPIGILSSSNEDVLTNKELVVLQGGEQTLNKKHLWLQSANSGDILYNVIQEPKHGRLIRDSPHGEPRFEGAIKLFSNEDLESQRLIYKHDGSRTTSDEFHFFASQGSLDSPKKVMGVFKIRIQFKNEHAPVRIVDKVFNVVRHGQRLLTTDVIQFKDDDSNFNDTQIVYSREGILSGNIVLASNPSQNVFRFTQADLRDKNILFVHHGADLEQFPLQVSDGYYLTTTLLRIQAGDPYLRVMNNAIFLIDHGSTRTIDTNVLSADSNMDIRDDSEIKFEVTSPPTEGKIIVSGIEALEFTQEDLKKGVVSYEHSDESLKAKDSFSFTVRTNRAEHYERGEFKITLNQGYFSELEVINNEIIFSFEGEPTIISQEHLKVEEAGILPTGTIYTLKKLPEIGHVVMLKNSSDVTASPVLEYVQSFSQEDIDLGRVFYVSALWQEGDYSTMDRHDEFILDVSNGFNTLENLTIIVDIIPRFIPIQSSNFTIKEGLSKALDTEILNISHPFYNSLNIEFTVEEFPQNGEIRDDEGNELHYFAWDDVKMGKIFYMHDSSETTEDSFTLSASSYENNRRSHNVTISVSIIPVNDEPPKVTRNTGLEVFANEEAIITASMLSTEDKDTPAEELVYQIEIPTNGMVALKEEPGESIQNFSQAHINRGEIIFIHEGEQSGGFKFIVTDGEHTSPLYLFVITAKPHTITLVTGEELVVFPGTRQQINSTNLNVPTSEAGSDASFLLIRPPRLGRLILAKDQNQFEEITLFTQSQLESGVLYYEHQLPTEPFWVVRDSMEFTMSSQTEVRHFLPITVSYYAPHSNVSSQMWRNKGLETMQGQRKTIDSSIFDASNLLASLPEESGPNVVFEIKRFPNNGRIILSGKELPGNAPHFTQEDVSQGRLEYLHGGLGGSSDSFLFRAHLKSEGDDLDSHAESVYLEEIFSISVKQHRASPPKLVTTDMLLEVLQGSRTLLTEKHLNVQDEDSPPDEVVFIVTKEPRNGHLFNTVTSEPIAKFSQEMINRKVVAFQSDGTLANGFVEFTITDGKHVTVRHTLHIGVLARTLHLEQVPEIKVRQGDDQTLVTEKMLMASTGGPVEEDILYKITSTPKYAAVMVDRQPTSAFTQKQIKEGRVSVRFIKSTSSRDSVSFTARSRAANVSSVLNITVQPLAKISQNPLLPQGSLVQLDRKLLDATLLANKTSGSPTFTVIQEPKGARIVKLVGPDAGQPVQTFSQKDLDEGRVAMEIRNPAPSSKAMKDQDEVRFLLQSHGVPPAECLLSFQTSPYNASTVYPATLLRTPEDALRDFTTASPGIAQISRRGNFWSVFIPILVVLLLLLLAGVLAYYLIRKNKTGKHNVQTAASKPKNGEVATTETFRKTDPANNIPMSNVDSKGADPELLQHCRTTNQKKNQYWV
ncbi:chondroitin sulfate proteoglycan 4 [Cyprinodon tularosa]|uniref:chondroitin sulfate proteoglycan 4 n=1 Tax=Cyprinodon tularosa TaxID=77115 RepID=UPI0018E23186|nr:chondroitin sulfate proteoglycan 4 [Cyprinodon tularosa]